MSVAQGEKNNIVLGSALMVVVAELQIRLVTNSPTVQITLYTRVFICHGKCAYLTAMIK